jgi:hypothetical protein
MFATREYFLRSRAAFLEQRGACKMVIHMTNNQIIPWVGAADIAYDGEHHVIYPEMKKDFMDFWSLERLRVDYPVQWGVAVNFMHEYQGDWDPVDLHRVMRAYFAAVMLHDALPTGNHNGHARNLVEMRQKFGIGADDVRFLPYWEESGLRADNKDIKLAGWLRPGTTSQSGDAASLPSPSKLLLLVANFGEAQTAEVTVDTAKLGWNGKVLGVADAEAGYRQQTSRRTRKSDAELAADKDRHEKAEAARLGKNPASAPKPYKENPWKNEPVVAWDGDRLLVVETKP